MVVDAPSYYTYLPAAIVYGDLHLNYIDKNPSFFKDKIWYYKIENNQKLIKHPMGVSVMLAPFFLAGHWIAGWIGSPQDGYSMPYQNATTMGVLFYLFIGLFFLRKILLSYFSEKIVAVTLISIVLATNLLWYSTFEALMPHAVSFSLWTICIWTFFNWIKTETKKCLIYFGIAFGLIVLIRPLSAVSILFFIVYGITAKGGFSGFVALIKSNFKTVAMTKLTAIAIACLQLCYWKYATGHWLYDVYKDEHFVFNSPQILPFLFSFRKGVFIYTPVLIFSVFGLIYFFKKNKTLFYSILVLMSISIYLLSSWWAWSYGISWGIRPMIDYYAVLSIPFAAGINYFYNRSKVFSYCVSFVIFIFVILNLFQTWQYKKGLIHYDDMSKEAYFKGFFQTKEADGWRDMLKPYDWERRINGLSQIKYSQEYFNEMDAKQTISLRGSNLKYITVNPKAQNAMASLAIERGVNELFFIERQLGDTVCIRSNDGWLWSLKTEYENVITASAMQKKSSEKFTIEYIDADDNRIAIKAANNKFITIGDKWPFVITANSTTLGKNEIFRYFVVDK